MKTFKQYNESVRDYLQPKSEEEIIHVIKNFPISNQIATIISNGYSYDYLPRNNDGICVCPTSLNVANTKITNLPENLTVNGNFNCVRNLFLTKLPKGLVVKGDFLCQENMIREFPIDLTVDGDIWAFGNSRYLEKHTPYSLPNVKGKIYFLPHMR